MSLRLLPFGMAAALAATGCGGGDSEFDAQGTTKEQRAFSAVQDAERKAYLDACARAAAPQPIVRSKLLRADAKDLKDTVVVAHPSVPFPAGKNAIWCATFSLAWDALCRDVNGGPLALGPPAPADLVRRLDAEPFPREALDPACFLARAGLVKDGIVDSIARELTDRFQAQMLPVPDLPGDGAVAYGYLRKSLPFEHLFEPVHGYLRFAGGPKKVTAFGLDADSENPKAEEILSQVAVFREVTEAGEEDPSQFALEFAVKDRRDRLILAMVPPGESLEATWQSVRPSIDLGKRRLSAGDTLVVPKMNFEVDRRFQEILGAAIGKGRLAGQTIAEARQTVRFSLDEGGADLESHAVLATLGIHHSYIVSRPFLLALLQKGAKEPYLLLWIANDELLAEAP